MSGFKLSDPSSPHVPPSEPARSGTPSTADRFEQPLGLTVHAVPSPVQAAQADGQRTRLGRWKMLAVMLVCATPVIASYITYYLVRPEGRRNFSELIAPPRELPALLGTTLDGKSIDLRTLKGQWLLLSVAGGDCPEACRQHLYLQRQMRESLGKEKDRLDRVWLITDEAPVAADLQPALAQATVLRVPPAALAQWLQAADGQQLADHLYVVDPIGMWMMRLPAGLNLTTAPKAKRDLDRLLRASVFWDRAGREEPIQKSTP